MKTSGNVLYNVNTVKPTELPFTNGYDGKICFRVPLEHQCGRFSENGPHMLICWNTWLSIGRWISRCGLVEEGRKGGRIVATMVVVVRTVAEARSQSQCRVLRNGGPQGPHLPWGVPPLTSLFSLYWWF